MPSPFIQRPCVCCRSHAMATLPDMTADKLNRGDERFSEPTEEVQTSGAFPDTYSVSKLVCHFTSRK